MRYLGVVLWRVAAPALLTLSSHALLCTETAPLSRPESARAATTSMVDAEGPR
jgi:hypothetical protein